MGKNFEDLKVWQKSVDLAEAVYRIVSSFPKEEKYGLTSQITRSAISIASNIAEGSARESDKEFIRFLYIARGSSAELKTQFIVAQRVGYINADRLCPLFEVIDEITRMLNGLIRKLASANDQRLATSDLKLTTRM